MSATRGRLYAFLLLGSLAVNLFLGGMVATRWMRRSPMPGEAGPFSAFRIRRALGPNATPAVDRVWAKHEAEMGSRGREAADARRRAMQALTAEPYDAQRATAALAEFRTKAFFAQEGMHAAVVELAAELTPEQRRELGAALDQAGPGQGGRRRHGGGPTNGMGPGRGSGPPLLGLPGQPPTTPATGPAGPSPSASP